MTDFDFADDIGLLDNTYRPTGLVPSEAHQSRESVAKTIGVGKPEQGRSLTCRKESDC